MSWGSIVGAESGETGTVSASATLLATAANPFGSIVGADSGETGTASATNVFGSGGGGSAGIIPRHGSKVRLQDVPGPVLVW